MNVNISLSVEEMIKAVESGALQTLSQAIAKSDKEDLTKLKKATKKVAEATAKEVAEETPAEAPEEVPQEEALPEEEKVTKEDVRKVLADKKKAGKRDEVKALIEEYGVSRFPDIPEDKYPELIAKAREL